MGQARPKGQGNEGKEGGSDGHLGAAKAEDGRAHGPKAAGTKLEADEEQEEDDAELGEMEDRGDLVDGVDEAEAEGTDEDADEEVAQHVADAQQLGERRRHHGGGQEKRHLRQGHVGHALCPAALSRIRSFLRGGTTIPAGPRVDRDFGASGATVK